MKKTWLLGFGFFSISLTWALYNAFVPIFLERYIQSTALVGFMMTIDNYFAMFLQPWIGFRSDRTGSRFGKRMPYLMIGMPLGAIFFAMIPLHVSLITLVAFMVLMNLSMSLYRSPTVALMPDITPKPKQTQANGIINLMGGFGSILAFGVGSQLYKMNEAMPFILAGIVTLISLFIVFKFIKEKRDAITYTIAEKRSIKLRGELNRTTVLLLLAIFFWFISYQGVEALITLYGTKHLGMTEGDAAFALTFFSLAFLLFALPSGFLGKRYGKRRIIMIGVAGLLLVYLAMIFVKAVWLVYVMLACGGLFWACININSYPFIVSTGKESSIGTRTGLYYFVSSLAAITSPPLLGLVVDLFGYSMFFVYACGGLVLALLCMWLVRDSGKSIEPPADVPGTTVSHA